MKKKNIQGRVWVAAILVALSFSVRTSPAFAEKAKRSQPVKENKEELKKVSEGTEASTEVKADDKAETAAPRKGGADEPGGVLSKDFSDKDFEPRVEEESAAWMFVKMILLLGVFGGGFYFFYRFVSKKTGMSLFGGDAIRVLSVVPLGQNKYLQVVDLAGKMLVIGVSDNSINLISEITDKDQIDRIRIMSTRKPPPGGGGGGFQEQVMRQIGKFVERVQGARKGGGGRLESSGPPADIDYLRQQRERLKNMNGFDNE